MLAAFKHQEPELKSVALKAFSQIADRWSLTIPEAAKLADMSVSTWKRARKAGYSGDITHDQMLRLSAIVGIYKSIELYFDKPIASQWIKMQNRGPEFEGHRPIDALINGGLPKFLLVRNYLDALRGGI